MSWHLCLASSPGTTMSSATATVSATWWPTWPPRSKPTSQSIVTALCHITHILLNPELYIFTIRHCIIYNSVCFHLIVDPHYTPEERSHTEQMKRSKLVTNYFFFLFVEFPVLFLCEMDWRCESLCLSAVLMCCSQWWNKVLCLWDSCLPFLFCHCTEQICVGATPSV